MSETHPLLLRRSFLTQTGLGAAAAAAVGLGGAAGAGAQAPAAAAAAPRPFTPTRHAQDNWLDEGTGKHRLFLDALQGPGAGDSLLFAGNFLNSNKAAYSLTDADSNVVICFRHFATMFAWNDSIWAKYGDAFTSMTKLNDPKTGKPPTINLYRSADYGMQLNNLGTTIDALIARGVRFAVCDTATHLWTGAIAQATKGNEDAVYKELTSNTIPNSHYVSAGIVAVNRAQERGYSIAHCG
jgi:hypothetical protein